MSAKLEEILLKLGKPGKAQIISVFVVIFTFMQSISTNFLLPFITMHPKHQCKVPSWYGDPWFSSNDSIMWMEGNGNWSVDTCHVYVDPTNHSAGIRACAVDQEPGIQYRFPDGDARRTTVVTEWGLFCSSKYLVRVFQTSYFIGIGIGGILFGYLSDVWGRKCVWLSCILLQTALALLQYFVTDFVFSCVVLFIRGIFLQGQTMSANTMIMEMFPVRYRTRVGIFSLTTPGIALGVSNAIAYFIVDWRNQMLVQAAIVLIPLIGLYFVNESLRWQVSHGDLKGAKWQMRKTVRLNGLKEFPLKSMEGELVEVSQGIQECLKTSKKQNALQLFKNKLMRRTYLILMFNMFYAQICVYGFNFLIQDIGGNSYLNFLIVSIADTMLRSAAYFTVERIGRTTTTIMTLSVMGVANLIFTIAKSYQGSFAFLGTVANVSSLIGRCFNGVFFCAAILQANEIFPTTVRSTATGLLVSSGRCGLLLLPAILALGDYMWKQLPFFLFGVGGVLGGALSFMIPETKGAVLPNTLEEATEWAANNKRNRKCTPRNGQPTIGAPSKHHEEEGEEMVEATPTQPMIQPPTLSNQNEEKSER